MNELALHLHKKQYEVFHSKAQFRLFIAGRRLGKSYTLATSAIYKSLSSTVDKNSLSPSVIVIAAPTYQQVKSILFDPMVNLLSSQPFVKSINKSELIIRMKGSHPDILFRSAEAGERLRGLKMIGFYADEIADLSSEIWYDIVIPSLSDSGKEATALLIGTPKGKANWVYELYQQTLEDPSWAYFHGITADNPFFPKEALERAKRQLSPSSYTREFEADWSAYEGQIFDQLQDKHIIEVSIDPDDYDAVYMGLDWGSRNVANVVIGQKGSPPCYYIIDSWAPISEESIPFEVHKYKALEMATKYNVHSIFPDLFTPLHQEFISQLAQLGHPGLSNVDMNAKKFETMEACEIVNNIFYQDRLFINKDLYQFINRIRSYRRRKNPQGLFENKEAPNQPNHETDCMLYILSRVDPALTQMYELLGMLPKNNTPLIGDTAIKPSPELIYTRY